MIVYGNVNLVQAYEPEIDLDIDFERLQDLTINGSCTWEETVSGTVYSTLKTWQISLKDCTQAAGWYSTEGQYPALYIYGTGKNATTCSTDIHIVKETTGYDPEVSDTSGTFRGRGVNLLAIITADGNQAEDVSVSGGYGIPIFGTFDQCRTWLVTGEGYDDRLGNNGLENNEPTPTEGVRYNDYQYNYVDVDITGKGADEYREALYVRKVYDDVYIIAQFGKSFNGTILFPDSGVIGGSYKMEDSAGNSTSFPGVLYTYDGMAIPMNKLTLARDNGSYYAYTTTGVGANETSLAPEPLLSNITSASTTLTSDVPLFDDYETFILYLLGEVDDEDAIDTAITDRYVDNDDNNPSVTILSTEAVNFMDSVLVT